MRKFLRGKRVWIGALLFLVFCFWAVDSSESFQSCLAGESPDLQNAGYSHAAFVWTAEESPDVSIRTCLGEFLDENGEAIAAFFTAVLALSTILLWRQTRRLAELAGTQAQDMKAAIAAVQASAEATAKSVKIAQVQLRAQVMIAAPQIDQPQDGQPVTVHFELMNSGPTPARNIAVFGLVEMRALSSPDPFQPLQEIMPGFRCTLMRDARFPIVARTAATNFTAEFASSIAAKAAGIFVIAEIRYTDEFNEPRMSRCKYVYDWRNLRDNSRSLYSCPDGNDAT